MASNTRENIIKAALQICKKTTFDSVTYTDISAIVNLKIPSIKYYFKDKEQLFDGMIDYMREHCQKEYSFKKYENAMFADSVTVELFVEVILNFVSKFINDDEMCTLRNIYIVESRFNSKYFERLNSKMSDVFDKFFIDLFKAFQNNGRLNPKISLEALIMEFAGTVNNYGFLMEKNQDNEEKLKEINKLLENFIVKFWQQYNIKPPIAIKYNENEMSEFKQRFIDKTFEMFSQNIKDLTPIDVCRELSVPYLVYNSYFNSKEDFIDCMVNESVKILESFYETSKQKIADAKEKNFSADDYVDFYCETMFDILNKKNIRQALYFLFVNQKFDNYGRKCIEKYCYNMPTEFCADVLEFMISKNFISASVDKKTVAYSTFLPLYPMLYKSGIVSYSQEEMFHDYKKLVKAAFMPLSNEQIVVSPREEKTIKEKIMHTALKQFATYGYNNVCENTIAQEAEISINDLKFFYNKKSDILKDLLSWIDTMFVPFIREKTDIFYKIDTLTYEQYHKVLMDYAKNFMMLDEKMYVRYFLQRESYNNKEIRKIYQTHHMIIKIHVADIFRSLIDRGVLKMDYDLNTLAIQFMTPFTEALLFQLDSEGAKREALHKIENHINLFWKVYLEKNLPASN